MSNVKSWFKKSETYSGRASVTVKLCDDKSVGVMLEDPDREYVKQYPSKYHAEELFHTLAKAKQVDLELIESYGLRTV